MVDLGQKIDPNKGCFALKLFEILFYVLDIVVFFFLVPFKCNLLEFLPYILLSRHSLKPQFLILSVVFPYSLGKCQELVFRILDKALSMHDYTLWNEFFILMLIELTNEGSSGYVLQRLI